MEKKDNNKDEGRVKRKRRISTKKDEGRNGGGGWKGKGTATNERGEKKEEEEEAEAGNLDRVDHPLKPRVLVAVDPPLHPLR